MKFLLDQDVYAITARHLLGLGHDVVTVAQRGWSRRPDDELLTAAQGEGRILVTRDRDFGGLVFHRHSPAGVIYLRMLPATVTGVHAEISRVLLMHPESLLLAAFVVVEPGRHRVRHPRPIGN